MGVRILHVENQAKTFAKNQSCGDLHPMNRLRIYLTFQSFDNLILNQYKSSSAMKAQYEIR